MAQDEGIFFRLITNRYHQVGYICEIDSFSRPMKLKIKKVKNKSVIRDCSDTRMTFGLVIFSNSESESSKEGFISLCSTFRRFPKTLVLVDSALKFSMHHLYKTPIPKKPENRTMHAFKK
ncbi:hypothetical protein BpHYR1_001892 [Brachionus plicatilis]|uniref:Uncharacterized protein n=1 Tax=Brachionus plicatilis TaxID=10195 RepID=A0A3M7SJ50_BRAPC|nr:hypothetical protein BpHYR1_001892 [Brachionus plicatilis]